MPISGERRSCADPGNKQMGPGCERMASESPEIHAQTSRTFAGRGKKRSDGANFREQQLPARCNDGRSIEDL